MPPYQQGRARLLLFALVAVGTWAESPDACEGATCSVGDAASLVQRPHGRHRIDAHLQTETPITVTTCDMRLSGQSAPYSFINNTCAGAMCCYVYPHVSYPCPDSNIQSCALLVPPSLWTYGYLPNPNRIPDDVRNFNSYGPVKLSRSSCPFNLFGPSTRADLAHFLQQKSGIDIAVPLLQGQPGYDDAFFPQMLNASASMKYLWGDLGLEVNPGYGGIKTYNVVNFTPSTSEPLLLFHLTHWNDTDPKWIAKTPAEKLSHACDIWWGLEESYKTSLEDASVNVQTCERYNKLLRCSFTHEAEITAIVGQGWVRAEGGFKTMGCSNQSAPTNWVAEKLVGRNYPDADQDTLQFILPTCELAKHHSMKCDLCEFPDDKEKMMAIKDLASQFEKQDEGVTCRPFPLEALPGPAGPEMDYLSGEMSYLSDSDSDRKTIAVRRR